MAKSLPVENLLPQNEGVNYQLLALITEVARWGTPSCSWLQPAADNDVRVCRSNWLVAPPELHVLHGVNAAYKSQDCSFIYSRGVTSRDSTGMPDQRTTYPATQGINKGSVVIEGDFPRTVHLWRSLCPYLLSTLCNFV